MRSARRRLYEAVVKREAAGVERARLAQSTIASLIVPAETVAQRETPFDALMQMFLSRTVKYLYVVDDGNHIGRRGAPAGPVARDWSRIPTGRRGSQPTSCRPTSCLSRRRRTLAEALQCVQSLQAERIPVIDDPTTRTLLGVVRKSDLLDVLGRLALSRDT